LAAKFWMEPRGYRLRSLIWKLVLVALILSLLFFSYGSVRGMEPGVSLIVLLTSIKILEAHTAREFHIMIMVAWILCLCGFFLSPTASPPGAFHFWLILRRRLSASNFPMAKSLLSARCTGAVS